MQPKFFREQLRRRFDSGGPRSGVRREAGRALDLLGWGVVITKRGKPVARVVPIEEDDATDTLEGCILFEDDIVAPMHDVWQVKQ